MREVLCDSGPLAALFNRADNYHPQALAYFKRHGAHVRLLTTWEVVSEVMYFLDFSANAQADLLLWLHEGATRDRVRIASLQIEDLAGLSAMMRKYADARWTWRMHPWCGWPTESASPTSSRWTVPISPCTARINASRSKMCLASDHAGPSGTATAQCGRSFPRAFHP